MVYLKKRIRNNIIYFYEIQGYRDKKAGQQHLLFMTENDV